MRAEIHNGKTLEDQSVLSLLEAGVETMRVLYLWAGKEQSGVAAWKEDGHEIISVGIDKDAGLTICKDIADVTLEELELLGPFDFIWASPDCKVWSLAALHMNHWEKRGSEFVPMTARAIEMKSRVIHTLDLIQGLNPTYWVLENPKGILRKMRFMQNYQHHLVSYCQYGDTRMKPTDLWGRFPATFYPKYCGYNQPCHEPSPRGSHETGTQGMEWEERILIPYGLSRDLYVRSIESQGMTIPTLEDFI
tara:strand:+ start:3600 stop:4346 length:747 start_codon:yes stop_codon:yes gene_type:complete